MLRNRSPKLYIHRSLYPRQQLLPHSRSPVENPGNFRISEPPSAVDRPDKSIEDEGVPDFQIPKFAWIFDFQPGCRTEPG